MASAAKIAIKNHLSEGTLHSRISEEDLTIRKIQTILNKLTLENYQNFGDRLVLLMKNVDIMKEAITSIFAKAEIEQNLGFVYVDLIAKLLAETSEVQEGEQLVKFNSLFMNKCREELDEIAYVSANNSQEERFDAVQVEIDEDVEFEEEENELELKRKFFGRLKFVGTLFISGLLEEKHILSWIQVLLGDTNNPVVDHLEGLCLFLKTIGSHIDDEPLGECFERLLKFSKDPKLTTSLRFIILDVLELRNSQWMPIVPNSKYLLCSSGT